MGEPGPKDSASAPVVDSLEDIRARLRRRDAMLPTPPARLDEDGLLARALSAGRALTARAATIARATGALLSGWLRVAKPAVVVISVAIARAVRSSLSRTVPLVARVWAATTNALRSSIISLERRVEQRPVAPTLPARPDEPQQTTVEPQQATVEPDPPDEMLRQAEQRLAATERTLGYEHPSVADELQLIGALHHERANYTEALAFYEAALGIQRRTLGPNHPAVAATAADVEAARRNELESQEAEAQA